MNRNYEEVRVSLFSEYEVLMYEVIPINLAKKETSFFVMHSTFRIFVVRLLQLTTITPMKHIFLIAAIGCLFVLSACQGGAQKETAETEEVLNVPECVVTTPPDSLHLDAFYKK